MKKNNSLLAIYIACLFLAMPVSAQDIEKEFVTFEKQQQREFEDFKNKADAEFETFLRETWQKFDALAPVPAPVRPEPPKPVVFDKAKPALPPIAIKPGSLKVPDVPAPSINQKIPTGVKRPELPVITDKPAPGVYEPGKPYTPVLVEIPVVKPGAIVRRFPIEFYGTSFEVATDAIDGLSLTSNKEKDVADAWKSLCQKDYEQLLKDCITIRNEKGFSDWAYLLFTKQIGVQLYGSENKNNIRFLQMFLLNKSGYKVRLAKIDDELKLMIASAGTIYGTPYLTLGDTKYYVFEPTPGSSNGIYTYQQDFACARNLVCLNVDVIPAFTVQQHNREFALPGDNLKFQAVVNKNLIDFYQDYPQCDVVIRYKTPMSEELRSALYTHLKPIIAGKSQQQAANLLLKFVQSSFDYMTDGEQFGYEKPFFPDETFYYPYCDCEDRAMLYSTLVRDLLGLDAILLDYPNHIASAVEFTEEIAGDHIVLDNGKKYLICDPTYIGAPIGCSMDQYKQVSPEIIR